MVLPTPGPPVTTSTLDASALATVSFWLAARAIPSFPSAQGKVSASPALQKEKAQGGLFLQLNRLSQIYLHAIALRHHAFDRRQLPDTLKQAIGLDRTNRLADGAGHTFTNLASRSSWRSCQIT